jgi:hypothetical protein
MTARMPLAVLSSSLIAGLLPAAEPPGPDLFAGAVYRLKEARTGRVSSWDLR